MDKNSILLISGPAWLLISFLAYWPLFFKLQKEGRARSIILIRYYGAVLFGGIPLVLIWLLGKSPVMDLGLSVNLSDNQYIWLGSLVLGLLIFAVNFFFSKNHENLKEFPQIRANVWSTGLVVHNIISWIIYLVAYEILFRGLLLFPMVPVIGFWPAAVFGTVLYSLSHYPKSLKEALGAIPIGLILAWVAWETQSILPCIWIHVCMALSNSIFSLYHHPGMHIRKMSKKPKT